MKERIMASILVPFYRPQRGGFCSLLTAVLKKNCKDLRIHLSFFPVHPLWQPGSAFMKSLLRYLDAVNGYHITTQQ